jgi:GNAT superfamily N-acetyltransferase
MANTAVSIRDAVPGDIAALTVLINELGYPTSTDEMRARFDLIYGHPDYKTIVAVINGEIVGMAGLCKGLFYEMNGMYMRILALVVKDTNQDMGIGKLLISASETWAAAEGLKAVFINCGNRPEREKAHEFYRGHGYVVKSSGYFKLLV